MSVRYRYSIAESARDKDAELGQAKLYWLIKHEDPNFTKFLNEYAATRALDFEHETALIFARRAVNL